MENKELVKRLKQIKEERRWTLYDLSQKLGIQVTTLERWFKTNRINRIYAMYIREKLTQLN
jgi:transcriptional regulator with XRE-family HTH domain